MSVTPWIEKLAGRLTRTSVDLHSPTPAELAEQINKLPIVEQGRLRAATEASDVGFNRTTVAITPNGIRITQYRNNIEHKRTRVMIDLAQTGAPV